jgi:hypothetical protein
MLKHVEVNLCQKWHITESMCWRINPFSGRFLIASHIYMGEFPLPPAGI